MLREVGVWGYAVALGFDACVRSRLGTRVNSDARRLSRSLQYLLFRVVFLDLRRDPVVCLRVRNNM